jgi:hypothetical protein
MALTPDIMNLFSQLESKTTGEAESPPSQEESDGTETQEAGQQQTPEVESPTTLESAPKEEVPQPKVKEAATKPPEAQVEYLTITDDQGKRQIALDWNNKDAIRKAVQMAAGARKWQAERDSLKDSLSRIQTEHSEATSQLKNIEEAFERDGMRGLVNLLVGNQGAYDQWKDAEFQKWASYNNASPEQKAFFDAKAENEKLQKEMAWQRKQQEAAVAKAAKEAQEAQDKAERARQEENTAILHKEFRKHSFNGKLPVEEAKAIDNAIWHNAMSSLKELPAETELTPDLVSQAFQREAQRFSKLVDTAATTRVTKQKEAAQVRLQADAKSNVRAPSNKEEEFSSLIKKGGSDAKMEIFKKFLKGK